MVAIRQAIAGCHHHVVNVAGRRCRTGRNRNGHFSSAGFENEVAHNKFARRCSISGRERAQCDGHLTVRESAVIVSVSMHRVLVGRSRVLKIQHHEILAGNRIDGRNRGIEAGDLAFVLGRQERRQKQYRQEG